MKRWLIAAWGALHARLNAGFDEAFAEAAKKAERPEFCAKELHETADQATRVFNAMAKKLRQVTEDRDHWRRMYMRKNP